MGMMIDEKHELTLSFDTSDELWQFAKEHQDKIVAVTDYKVINWKVVKEEIIDGNL